MRNVLFHFNRMAVCASAGLLVAGCAITHPQKPPHRQAAHHPATSVRCQPAQPGDAAIGNWYGVRSQRGVAGKMHVLIHLRADGTMSYEEELKRGKRPSQALNETGCWRRDKQGLVLRTTMSNGDPVELADPIYTNRYAVRSQSRQHMELNGPFGPLGVRRMPGDYRLPF